MLRNHGGLDHEASPSPLMTLVLGFGFYFLRASLYTCLRTRLQLKLIGARVDFELNKYAIHNSA